MLSYEREREREREGFRLWFEGDRLSFGLN